MRRSRTALWRLLLSVAVTAGLLVLAWLWVGRDRPLVATLRYPSLSFAPYRSGQAPEGPWPSRAQVREDVARLAPFTAAIRTYSACDYGDTIPLAAKTAGIKVWLGVWLGSDPLQNQRELRCGIDLAQRFPSVIQRLTVGNEVVFRREISIATLIATLDKARAAIRQPVSYADIPAVWQQYPQIAGHVDEAAVHLLPYWDDSHFLKRGDARQESLNALRLLNQCRRAHPGLPFIVGEVGWPSAGRQRGAQIASRKFQGDFLAEFAGLAAQQSLYFNVVEAFDQPWKAAAEGAVGANWGVLDAERRAKVSADGSVSEAPRWRTQAGISVLILLVAMVLAVVMARRYRLDVFPLTPVDGAILSALNAMTAFCGPWLWRLCYSDGQRLAVIAAVAGQILFVNLCAIVLSAPARTKPTLALRGGVVVALSVTLGYQMLLAFSPYYRVFPVGYFAAVALALVWLQLRRPTLLADMQRLTGAAAVLLMAASLKVAISEGWSNTQSRLWLVVALVIAVLPAWRGLFHRGDRGWNGLLLALLLALAIKICGGDAWAALPVKAAAAIGMAVLIVAWALLRVRDSALRWVVVVGTLVLSVIHVYRMLYVDSGEVAQFCLAHPRWPVCRLREWVFQIQLMHVVGGIALVLALIACLRGSRRWSVAALIAGLTASLNWDGDYGAVAIVAAVLGYGGVPMARWRQELAASLRRDDGADAGNGARGDAMEDGKL